MGDDKVYNYVKKTVDEWEQHSTNIVTVDAVLNNVSAMECDGCHGSGHAADGSFCHACGPEFPDGLKTFEFVGTVTSVADTMVQKAHGEPANDYYRQKAEDEQAEADAQRDHHGQFVERFRTVLMFNVDDGENSVRCCVHNYSYIYPNGFSDEELPEVTSYIRESHKKATKIRVRGKPFPYREARGRELPFIFVSEVVRDMSDFESKLTDEELSNFINKCKETEDYPKSEYETQVLPMDIAKNELWVKMEMPEYLREVMMLWCVSPKKSQEQFHIALITNPGEGKDYMLREVLQPTARTGVAGSGSTTTYAALVGAMDPSDLTKISPGLFARFHHARVAVTEFNDWPIESWSAMLEVLGNAEVTLTKGEISGRKVPTCISLLLLGNPPSDFEEGISEKMSTLVCFGDHTYKMISRCTLIFVELKLTKDDLALRLKMLDNIDSDTGNIENERLKYFRKFFKEYFKRMSGMNVRMKPFFGRLNYVFGAIAENEKYKQLLAPKGRPDNRKFMQFSNLVKFYVKVNARGFVPGSDLLTVTDPDIRRAAKLFERGAASLADNFDLALLDISAMDSRILRYVIENPGKTIIQIRKELRVAADEYDTLVYESLQKLTTLGKIHELQPDGIYMPDRTEKWFVPERKESRNEPTPVSDNLERVQALASELVKHLSLPEQYAIDIAYRFVQTGDKLSEDSFASDTYAETHGQISEKNARDSYKFLKERAI